MGVAFSKVSAPAEGTDEPPMKCPMPSSLKRAMSRFALASFGCVCVETWMAMIRPP